jgi:DNA/RNA endonuclease YhcR with UshA esterase domain
MAKSRSQNYRRVILLLLIGCAYLATACAGGAAPARSPTAVATAVAAVPTNSPPPAPTATNTRPPAPTATAVSTATSVPTATPSPTATVSPTPTPTATNTPTARPTDTAVPPPTAVPSLTIGDLPAHLGSEVTITGQVVATASFAAGYKFTLADGSGRVTLLMWHNVYDDCWAAPDLNLGATVRATGTVGQFEGELQVAPNFGGQVKVTAAGGRPAVQPIGSLGDFMGQRVTVIGTISRLEGTGGGTKLFVTDESGEILVFIWNNTLDRIKNNTALGTPGTRVRVVGAVQEYRSNREIAPVLPYDVEVLP